MAIPLLLRAGSWLGGLFLGLVVALVTWMGVVGVVSAIWGESEATQTILAVLLVAFFILFVGLFRRLLLRWGTAWYAKREQEPDGAAAHDTGSPLIR